MARLYDNANQYNTTVDYTGDPHRPYNTSSDYGEQLTYAGNPTDETYDSGLGYDRAELSYDGDPIDVDQGYASPSISYGGGATGYNGSVTVEAAGAGSGLGSSGAVGVRTVLRTATGVGAGTSVAGFVRTVPVGAVSAGSGTSTVGTLRTAVAATSSAGAGSQAAVRLRETFQTTQSSGTSGSTFDAILGALRAASGVGGATAGDQAVSLRETFGGSSDAGAGSSVSTRLRTVLGITVSVGVSSSESLFVRETFNESRDDVVGWSYGVFWLNEGTNWEAVVKTRPRHMEQNGHPPFRRKVNYSMRVPR